MKDLAIELDDRPGTLAAMGEALGRAGVSIEGGGAWVVDGRGVAHFLFHDGDAARRALEAAGIRVLAVRDVVVQRLKQAVPGQLGMLTRRMAEAGVNIEVLYSDHDHQMILVVDDVGRGRTVADAWAREHVSARREPGRRTAEVEFERPPWAQRTFSFGQPPWMLADFIERLRGVLPRLDALLVGLDEPRAHRQLEGTWSIAQNIGHLSDVEELWQERLEDLREGKKTYTPAVGARFQELARRHQDRSVLETLEELRSRRSRLVEALAQASPDLQSAAAFHERLQVPMRLVDCAQFYAEHDDHHLLRIRRLRSMLGPDAG